MVSMQLPKKAQKTNEKKTDENKKKDKKQLAN